MGSKADFQHRLELSRILNVIIHYYAMLISIKCLIITWEFRCARHALKILECAFHGRFYVERR